MARFSSMNHVEETACPWLVLWMVPLFVVLSFAFTASSYKLQAGTTGLGATATYGLSGEPSEHRSDR